MTYLADVNVWLAQAYVAHVHHASARSWMEASESDTIAFCRVTQSGFLRLLTNPKVMGDDVLTTENAWQAYDKLRRNTQIEFASEPPGLDDAWRAATRQSHTGPNFWTDAYLAAFASATGFTIVTFDRGFRHYRTVPVRLLTHKA